MSPSGLPCGQAVSLRSAILRAEGPRLIGTALYGAVRRVVWDPWLTGLALSQLRGPDSLFFDKSPIRLVQIEDQLLK